LGFTPVEKGVAKKPENWMDWEIYRNLKDRDLKKEGIFIGEGRFVVERMISAGCDILSILCLPDYTGDIAGVPKNRYPVIEKTKDELQQITGFRFHRGILAAARRLEFPDLDTWLPTLPPKAAVAVLPSISEAENTGSIIRSAVAFSLTGVALGPGSIDPLSRKAIRCSMGAVFDMPIAMFEGHDAAVTTLHQHGFHIIGATPSSRGESLRGFQFPGKSAIVLGHEADGLTPPWERGCDSYVRIPISGGVDSLNAGVAAGIVFYALARGRGTLY
jgi:tRNA G18 (ribose-2'-O)-methylase SpoU